MPEEPYTSKWFSLLRVHFPVKPADFYYFNYFFDKGRDSHEGKLKYILMWKAKDGSEVLAVKKTVETACIFDMVSPNLAFLNYFLIKCNAVSCDNALNAC